MMRLSKAEFAAIKRKSEDRAKRRLENAAFQAAAKKAQGIEAPKRKKRRKPSDRKTAFLRLKEALKTFVLIRAKKRTGGQCEVGVLCGRGCLAVLPYHIFPAATGNAIKYDPRNVVGGCERCNGGEYFDRKRGTYARWDARHKEILGDALWAELKALAGRKPISIAEAVEMTEAIKARTEKGDYE